MSALTITLFGAPRIARDGAAVTVERRKSLALLAYLAVTGQPHGRDALATLLWPDFDAERARAGLRRALVDLNAALGKGWVAAEGDQIALRAEPGLQSDIGRFHGALARVAAHSHPPQRLCDACLAGLTEAADLYTADFLAGFTLEDTADFDEWQSFQTESLRLELAGALEKLATGLAGRQEYAAALPHARRWLALDPLHEPAHRLLMQVHAGAGDRAAALRQYDACGKILHDELGIAPEPETTALAETIRRGTAGDPAPAFAGVLAATPPHNLPSDPTPFIGRAGELAQLAARLADPACRLLTILGPGGMGKTRLAIQAARSQTDLFAHGVFFVDLAPVTAAELLATTILQALSITGPAADAQTHLLRYLRDKHALLILDNFEQLAEVGAELLPKLLSAAPKVKLLVTSRVRLNLREEWLAPLAGMETPLEETRWGGSNPPPETARPPQRPVLASEGAAQLQPGDFQSLARYSATALFLACMRRVRPDFQPGDDDARQIVHICRLLDGMPLALELAAARTRALPLNEVARELEHGLNLLATKARDVPERQRSMTATFDYSWGLLSPHERSILRQASVFRGGFTREAAEATTGAALGDLDSLCDACWINLAASGRYDMHELARQYCAEKLAVEHAAESDETPDRVRNRHAIFFSTLLVAQSGQFFRRPAVISELTADRDNLLAAWHWATATDHLETIRMMIPGLQRIANSEGWERSLKLLLAACVGQLKATSAAENLAAGRRREMTLVSAIALDAMLTGSQGDSQEAWQGRVDEATTLLASGDPTDERWMEIDWRLRFHIAYGHLCWRNCTESANLFAALLPELAQDRFKLWPYTEEAGYVWRAGLYLWWGYDALHLGQHDEARRLAEQCLAIGVQSGIPFLKMPGLILLSSVMLTTGDCPQAERYLREYLRISRAHGLKYLVAVALYHLGLALIGQARYAQAQTCLQRSLAWGKETGQLLSASIQALGTVELAVGNSLQAQRCYEQAVSLNEGAGSSIGLANALTGLARALIARGNLGMARGHLLRSLELLRGVCALEFVIGTIAAMTELLDAEGQMEAAVELCAALLSWPFTPYCTHDTAQRVRPDLATRLQGLAARLPPEIFAAATARGRQRQIDEVVAELIGEPARQAADDAAALI